MKNTFNKMFDEIQYYLRKYSIVIQLYFYGFFAIFTNRFDEKRIQLEDDYAKWYTVEGRRLLAQSMVIPIRRALDYQGIGRRLLMVDELPQGAYAIYNPVISAGNNFLQIQQQLFNDQFNMATEQPYINLVSEEVALYNYLIWRSEVKIEEEWIRRKEKVINSITELELGG